MFYCADFSSRSRAAASRCFSRLFTRISRSLSFEALHSSLLILRACLPIRLFIETSVSIPKDWVRALGVRGDPGSASTTFGTCFRGFTSIHSEESSAVIHNLHREESKKNVIKGVQE